MIGPRAASIPIQLLALVLGFLDGSLLYPTIAGPLLVLKVVPESLDLALRFLCIVFIAYFLAAPGTWRGLWRRAFQVLAVSLLGFAALGYLFAFAGLPIGGLPYYNSVAQLGVVVFGLAAVGVSIFLREGKRPRASIHSPEVLPIENPLGSSPETPS